MFVGELFVSKAWKQMFFNRRMDRFSNMSSIKHSALMNMAELGLHLAAWMNLKNILEWKKNSFVRICTT